MSDLDDVYNMEILEKAAAIARTERLAHPDATAKAHSKLCGSTVTVDIVMQEEHISDYAHKVEACLLGQAAAAIVAENVIGKTRQDIEHVRDDMRAMLKDGGAPPSGEWSSLAVLQPVKDYPGRHASTLLVFDALLDAINEVANNAEGVISDVGLSS